ncbi:CutA1 divalent ion tolerance protein [Stanieria cyanosphaera PCC 7437]|uniref:CutA1 divalent ion tolerance protein n=1 Tax=Stanieria cyanosphaera (strain ATCC 29371 / PCC 7437) TaxID=111780 RepID=K9XMV8_STAC7|nr:divalent-cation tolerance protein CutA [Stanieria cyanosphaera]AFZ33935.1 CutA1 divalent ion tolerance protein [Stanieria cyanosphaera PCC 7437]
MTTNSIEYCVVLVTVATEAQAQEIAQVLLSKKLAACVNIFPVNSMYVWQSKLNQDYEWQLLIKTNVNQFDLLAQKIKAIHSYEVPEIIALPIINGLQSYLNWIDSNLS